MELNFTERRKFWPLPLGSANCDERTNDSKVYWEMFWDVGLDYRADLNRVPNQGCKLWMACFH